jgi:FkbH-like protein
MRDPVSGLASLRETLRAQRTEGIEIELVGRLLAACAARSPDGVRKLRVAVLSGHTSEPLANAMRVAALREGWLAEVHETALGTYRQEILAASSSMYVFAPEIVLIAPAAAELQPVPTVGANEAHVEACADSVVQQWQRQLWDTLNARLGVPILQHVVELPESMYLGVAERRAPWAPANFIDRVNRKLIDAAPGTVRWLDVDHLAASVGRRNWSDPRMFFHGRFGFSSRFLPDYVELLAAALRAATGLTRKALVVDLDNTLWGGIVGDDGLDGIRLGPGSAEGEAHLQFCDYLRALSQRGVVLAICSKNEPAVAMEVFRSHPHMPLRPENFAAVRCNWNDKANNLREIASELNIDLSAIAFVDDNPAECELIAQQLPQVAVLQLSGDPASFTREFDGRHWFDSGAYSAEDLKRSESYQGRAQSESLQSVSGDLASYLASLQMRGTVCVPGAAEWPRLAQMEMKTNQFNLSTRRLTMEQLQGMTESTRHIVLAVRLADRFTNHGLVTYIAAEIDSHIACITDWLMSCRVFSRTLEHFILGNLAARARASGVHTITAQLTPTPKNKVMEGLFETLGFTCEGTPPHGPWHYDLCANRPLPSTFIAG